MTFTKREIIQIAIGTALVLFGVAIAGILILANQDKHLFLATSLFDGFAAGATFVFVLFGLNRYLANKDMTENEKKTASKTALWFAIGTAVLVLFLIPFGKVMIERENEIVIWAVAVASVIAIIGTLICIVAGINWNQQVLNKAKKEKV